MDDYFIEWMMRPSPEALLFWEDFKKNNPSGTEELEKAIYLYRALHLNNHYLREAEVQELKEKLFKEVVQGKKAGRQAIFFSPWIKVAAAVLVVAMAGFFLYRAAPDRTVVIATVYGEHREITLPDESVVTLNGNSSLRYSKDFNTETIREVWLEGEAFFAVTELKPKKFIVHTADLDVEVLGTTFNVDDRESMTKVVLSTGSITVHLNADDTREQILLSPGEMIEYKKSAGVIVKQEVDPELYASWKDHALNFDRVAVDDIAERLEERYGYDITIADAALGKKFFTGRFSSDDIGIVILAMEKALGMEVIYEGKMKMIWKLS